MKSLKSIVLNWISGDKTPIPVRFLKSVDIPGNGYGNDNKNVLIINAGNIYDINTYSNKLSSSDFENAKNAFLAGIPVIINGKYESSIEMSIKVISFCPESIADGTPKVLGAHSCYISDTLTPQECSFTFVEDIE